MKTYLATTARLRFGLLLALLLGSLAAHAQNKCPTDKPATCPEPFMVVDAASGLEVLTLQVGCPVRFVQNCGRATDPTLLYYQVVKNTNGAAGTTPPGCLPTTLPGVTTYTPTAADVGEVTVFELSNPRPPSTAGGVAYVRNYTVVAPVPPTFTVAPCSGTTALVTPTTTTYDRYTIQVNGGAPQLLTGRQPLQVVIAPGVANTFVLTGSFTGNSCGITNTQTLTLPVAQTPVLVQVLRTDATPSGGPAQISFGQVSAGFTYTLQIADAPGQPYRSLANVPVLPGPPSVTYSLSPAPAGSYRLLRTDACGNTEPSNPAITLGLSGTAANGRNTLTFTPFDPAVVTGYTLTRSPGGLTVPLPGTAASYDDASVQCGTVYTYRLTANLVGGAQTVSNTTSLTAISTTPPPTPLVVASFDLQNRVVVTATPGAGAAFAAGGQVAISRQGGAGALAYPLLPTGKGGVPSRGVRDSTALATLLAAPPCYSATVRDTCGNVSAASASSCPALLTVEAADPEGQTARLRWSAFQGPGSPGAGAVYRVLTLAADGTVLATSASTTALTYLDLAPPTDRQILRYRVEARGAGLPTGTVSYSNVSTLTRQPRLAIPNAFTPNGDGLNDVLELKGRYLQNFTFIVVDRNGQEVFRATDRTQTWDGSINGHAPVNAAYVWHLDLHGEDGQTLRQTGTITILK